MRNGRVDLEIGDSRIPDVDGKTLTLNPCSSRRQDGSQLACFYARRARPAGNVMHAVLT